jgi:hypothetical protein
MAEPTFTCHCEHLRGAWQSHWKRQDCGACSERSEESRSGLLRLRLATSLAMTTFIAGFGYMFIHSELCYNGYLIRGNLFTHSPLWSSEAYSTGSEAFASLLSELVYLNICKRIRSKTVTYYQHLK